MYEINVMKERVQINLYTPTKKGRRYLASHEYTAKTRDELRAAVAEGMGMVAEQSAFIKGRRRELRQYNVNKGGA